MVRLSAPAFVRITVLCFLASAIYSNSQAGPATPSGDVNDDLIKMISAGLPESVVITKIEERAGQWDTSVDALIVLKKAGATEAEFAALGAGPQPTNDASQPVITSFMGGTLKKTISGDPMLSFPPELSSRFLDAQATNSAFLVTYKDSPAILVPGLRFIPNCCYSVANVLFLHDKLVFDFYLWEKIGAQEASGFARITSSSIFPEAGNQLPLEVSRMGLQFQPNQVAPCRIQLRADSKEPEVTFDRLVRAGGGQNCAFDFSMMFGTFAPGGGVYAVQQVRSAGLTAFIGSLMNNFDSVLAGWKRAARITDPATQLSAEGNYTPVTDADQERYMAEAKDMQKPPAASSGGGLKKMLGLGKKASAAQGDSASAPSNPASQATPPQSPQAPQSPQFNAAGAQSQPPQFGQAQQPAASYSIPSQAASAPPPNADLNGQPAYTASGNNTALATGTASGPGSAPAGGSGSAPVPSSNISMQKKFPIRTGCKEPPNAIDLDAYWTNDRKEEVVGYFSNNNSDYVSCVYVFHKNGKWDMNNASTIVLAAGVQHQGGEMNSVWDKGDDSSNIKYQCYIGRMPEDANGDDCLGSVVFTGPPAPGTEK